MKKILLLIFTLNWCQSKKIKTTTAPGQWSTYGPWSDCSKTCGIGVRRRIRTCSYTGSEESRKCKGNIGQMKNCDTKITCPVDGAWSAWEAWNCTATCGGGNGMQKRSCTNPKPMFGGKDCEGPSEEKGKCNMQKCPDEIYTFSPMTNKAIENSLYKESRNFEKNEGDEVRLTCSPEAITKVYEEYSKTSLMWTKNGKVLKIDHDRMTVSLTELSIRKLTSNDSGIYACSVLYGTQIIKPISVAAVSVTPSSPNMRITAGDSMKLICHGSHLAKIFKGATQNWLLNGQEYEDFGTASPIESSVYEIENVKKNMSGIWSCRITDPRTSGQWIANILRVEVLPPPPVFLKFLNNTNVLLIIGILFFIFIMVIGTALAYKITKSRKEYKNDFEKWCQIMEWEAIKAGGVPEWVTKKENTETKMKRTYEESDSGEEK